jgi:hypothetical protein
MKTLRMAAIAAALAWSVGAFSAPVAQAGQTGIAIRGSRTAAGFVDIPKDVSFNPSDVLKADVQGSYAVVELRKVGAPDVSAGVFAVPSFGSVKVGGWAPDGNRLTKGRYLVTLVTDGVADIIIHLCELLKLIPVPLTKASTAFAKLKSATGDSSPLAAAYELRQTVRVPKGYRALTVSYVDALATSKAAACLVAKGAACAAGSTNLAGLAPGARQDVRTFEGSVSQATAMDAVGQFDGHVSPKAFGLFVAVFPA